MKYIGHECGIVAVVLKRPLTEYPEGGATFYGIEALRKLRNRGQEGAGIASYNPHREGKSLSVHKEPGTVDEVFNSDDLLKQFEGTRAIGHTRYMTSGSDRKDVQPFYRRHGNRQKKFALAFNGNLANYDDLKKMLEIEHHYEIETKVDTEVLMHLIAISLKAQEIKKANGSHDLTENFDLDYSEVPGDIYKQLDGSYNIVLLNGKGELHAFRDPHGFRPLVYGENSDIFGIASESVALRQIGINSFRDVKPGEVISMKNGKLESRMFAPERTSHCFFEYLYFGNYGSRFNGVGVRQVRKRLGLELAKTFSEEYKVKGAIIVPVPKTSLPIAKAMAGSLMLPYIEAIRTTHQQRSFIERSGMREERALHKYIYDSNAIQGKHVHLVDDSIVRGLTLKTLISQIKEYNPASVHLWSACPPISHPCFYGIDFSSRGELAASGIADIHDLTKKLAHDVGADSIHYQTLEGLLNSYPESIRNKLCTACLTGRYPTSAGQEQADGALRTELAAV